MAESVRKTSAVQSDRVRLSSEPKISVEELALLSNAASRGQEVYLHLGGLRRR
jgi:hypothetical protein